MVTKLNTWNIKTVKFDYSTKMFASCELFDIYTGNIDDDLLDQSDDTEDEKEATSGRGVDPNEKCPGTKEMFKKGALINFKIKDGTITQVTFYY